MGKYHTAQWESFLFLSFFFSFYFFLLHPNTAPLADSSTSSPANNLSFAGKYSFSLSYAKQRCKNKEL